jgi:hypothetical protein
MPHLDVCDPSDCRVAFISRGRPQEVTSVASDASAVRWWHCRHRKTNRQSMAIESTRSMVDLCALYRLDLRESGDKDKAAWIEKKPQCLLLYLQPDFAPRAPSSSRPCISCSKQPAGVLELAELERKRKRIAHSAERSPRAGNRVTFARTGSPQKRSITHHADGIWEYGIPMGCHRPRQPPGCLPLYMGRTAASSKNTMPVDGPAPRPSERSDLPASACAVRGRTEGCSGVSSIFDGHRLSTGDDHISLLPVPRALWALSRD